MSEPNAFLHSQLNIYRGIRSKRTWLWLPQLILVGFPKFCWYLMKCQKSKIQIVKEKLDTRPFPRAPKNQLRQLEPSSIFSHENDCNKLTFKAQTRDPPIKPFFAFFKIGKERWIPTNEFWSIAFCNNGWVLASSAFVLQRVSQKFLYTCISPVHVYSSCRHV